jgi:hypothetical protein
MTMHSVAETPATLPPGWRFVQPTTRRLELTEGDWILVKTRLTAGERRAAWSRMVIYASDGTRSINPHMVGLSTILAYLVDWNVTDPTGRVAPLHTLDGQDPIGLATAALDQLDPESFDEILQAIKAHELAMIAEREAEKKTRHGDPPSSATSRSPVTITGRMTTSPRSTPTSTP